MSNNVTVTVGSICNEIFEIALRCRNHNIGEVFISVFITQQLNDLLYSRCIDYGYGFIDNGAVSKIDILIDGIRLLDSSKTKIANNLISSFNFFLGTVILNSRSH